MLKFRLKSSVSLFAMAVQAASRGHKLEAEGRAPLGPKQLAAIDPISAALA